MEMAMILILSVAAPLCMVVLILGCLNCFMKRKPGFAPFSNSKSVEEGASGRDNDAFAVDMEPTGATIQNNSVVIEPIPDVTPLPVPLPPLRPKIIFADNTKEDSSLSIFTSHRPFPRENLTYLNPLGVGWFGQVIVTEALRIQSGSMRSKVVVKMLKDDASSSEEKQFIEEILPFRHLDHPNVLSLLGQCTEARPYLYIVEHAPHGDLKTFLHHNKQNGDHLMKKNRLLQFCLDAASGVACIHRHNFVHCDISTRNCLVGGNYKIKIGDYGLPEEVFKEDYLRTKSEILPIRWMAPECIAVTDDNDWKSQNFSKASDVWSFGVLIWEVFSMGHRPHDMLTDEAVIQGVLLDRVVTLKETLLRVPFQDRLLGLMNECWKDAGNRITIENVYQVLEQISKEKVESVADDLDFDQKWNHLLPNSQSRSESLISDDGSGIALAGSFTSETFFNRHPPAASQTDSLPSLKYTDNMSNVTITNEILKDEDVTIDNSEIDTSFDSVTPAKGPAPSMVTSTPLVTKSSIKLEPVELFPSSLQTLSADSTNTSTEESNQSIQVDSSLRFEEVKDNNAKENKELVGKDEHLNTNSDTIVNAFVESSENNTSNRKSEDCFGEFEIAVDMSDKTSHGFEKLKENNVEEHKEELMEKANQVNENNDMDVFIESSENSASNNKSENDFGDFEIGFDNMSNGNDVFGLPESNNCVPENQDLKTTDIFVSHKAASQNESLVETTNINITPTSKSDDNPSSANVFETFDEGENLNQAQVKTGIDISSNNAADQMKENPDPLSNLSNDKSNNSIFADISTPSLAQEVEVKHNSFNSLSAWETPVIMADSSKVTEQAKQPDSSLSFIEPDISSEVAQDGNLSMTSSDFIFVEDPALSSDVGDSNKHALLTDSSAADSLFSGNEINLFQDNSASQSISNKPFDPFSTTMENSSNSQNLEQQNQTTGSYNLQQSTDSFEFLGFDSQQPTNNKADSQNLATSDVFSANFKDTGIEFSNEEKSFSSNVSSDFFGLDPFSGFDATSAPSEDQSAKSDLVSTSPGDIQPFSSTDVKTSPSPSNDLLGLGFDSPFSGSTSSITPTEQSSDNASQPLQDAMASTGTVEDPFDSLI